MQRTFTTSPEHDAALAWKVGQVRADSGEKITEDQLIAAFVTDALEKLVAASLDDEAVKVFAAFKDASLADRAAIKGTLKL